MRLSLRAATLLKVLMLRAQLLALATARPTLTLETMGIETGEPSVV